MAEERQKGWHPDPFGHYAERYYYADNQPGRLVRDAKRNEKYDDIPEEHDAAPWADDLPPDELAPLWEPVTAPTPRRPSDPDDPSRPDVPGGPMFDDEPVRWRTALAERLEALHLPKVTLTLPRRTGKPLGRRAWTTIGAATALVVAVVALTLSLSGPSTQPGQSITSTTDHNVSPGRSPGPSVSASAWRIAAAFPHTAENITGVSCPTFADCFAVGETTLLSGLVLSSTDAGHTWVQQAVPRGVGGLTAVSCASGTSCVAVGGITVITTTDGGSNWTVALLGHNRLTAVSCPSVSACMVAGVNPPQGSGCPVGTSYTTVNGGHTWTPTNLSCFLPRGLTCPDAAHCEMSGSGVATGMTQAEVVATSNGGVTWHTQFMSPLSGSTLASIACPSTRVCIAVGSLHQDKILATSDGGHRWQPQPVPRRASSVSLNAIACESNLVCQAVGSTDLATDDGGSRWVPLRWPQNIATVGAVSCPLVVSCIASGTSSISGATLLRYG